MRGIRRHGGKHITSDEASASPSAESACEARILRHSLGQSRRPGGMNLCFWTTKEAGPYLNRARAKHESSRNATPICNPSRCNGRKTYGVHNGRQQRGEAGLLAFRIVCHKTAPVEPNDYGPALVSDRESTY